MPSVSSSSVQATDCTICVFVSLTSKNLRYHNWNRLWNHSQFSDLDSMPDKINLARLDSGNGSQSTFKQLNAECHKSVLWSLDELNWNVQSESKSPRKAGVIQSKLSHVAVAVAHMLLLRQTGNERKITRSLHVSTKDYGACWWCCCAGLPEDPDVVVLAVAVAQQLTQTEQTELWIAFGCGEDFRYIRVHKMCDSLSPQRSLTLHACTGCDTVSHFVQVGKKTR